MRCLRVRPDRERQRPLPRVRQDPETVAAEATLFYSPGGVDFSMKIEEEFEVDIPDEAAQEVRTVRDAVELLRFLMG